ALPIGQITVLVSTNAAYTAGASTINAVFVNVFTSTGGTPDTAETISLQLVSGGTALSNAVTASFVTTPNTIVHNLSAVFYHAGTNHQLRATAASGITGISASNRLFSVV